MVELRYGIVLVVAILVGVPAAQAQVDDNEAVRQMKESDRPAPIDWGYGPGVKPSQAAKPKAKTSPPATTATTPNALR